MAWNSTIGDSIDNGSKARGYNDEVLEVSSNSYSLGSDFSSSIDHSAIEGSNDFSAFLIQLLEKVGDNIVAPTVVQPETSTKVVPQPKKHPVLKEKCLPPPIMLPRYT